MGQVIFITGTDTGVGKTLLTALLLVHLRRSTHALAMKPFCSGSRSDARVLSAAQDHEVPLASVNPFYFPDPLAPLAASRRTGPNIALAQVLEKICALASRCEVLLVEGAGGLMVPLGEGYGVADLASALGCAVLVVARNRLGVLNHTLLTLAALRQQKLPAVKIVLMNSQRTDLASQTNPALLAELAAPVQVFTVPFLGVQAKAPGSLKKNSKKFKKTLAQLLPMDTLSSAFRTDGQRK